MSAKKHTPLFKQLLEKLESIDDKTSITEQMLVAKSSEELRFLLKFTPDEKYAIHKRLVILEFVATWCGLCKQVSFESILRLAKLCLCTVNISAAPSTVNCGVTFPTVIWQYSELLMT